MRGADRVRLAAVAVLALLALAVGARSAAAVNDPHDARGPLDLATASLGQDGQDLVLGLRTRGPWSAAELAGASGRLVCLYLSRDTRHPPDAQVCVAPGRRGSTVLRYSRLDSSGGASDSHLLRARVQRRGRFVLRARFSYADVGLRVGRFRWALRTAWVGGAPCTAAADRRAPRACVDALPDHGTLAARIVPAIPDGCVPHPPFQRFNGSRARRVVALTFDDGPSIYTPGFLHVLEREHVHATFFLIGQQVPGHEALLRRMLRDGDAIGNHTLTHADVSGAGSGARYEISRTNEIIRRVSGGYEPCLLRPPYGSTSSTLVGLARSLGLATIVWDVDPTDWARPGTDAIYQRIMAQVQRGSIILDHDGGGPRDETLAALPRVIHALRRRGYSFETVPQLLGFRPTYR